MIFIPIIILIYLVSIAASDKSPKIKKNPRNVVAVADFPFGGDTQVKENVVFSAKEGKHVNVHIDMTGLPKDEGPFFYHIHERSVPGNGNCEAVGLHFNPYNASPVCDEQKNDAYCQVGDLLGKHGCINTTCFELKYSDPYLSLNRKSKSYIIGKSVVFHYPNLTKIACADIEEANELRLQSLIDEYTQTDYAIQLKELNTPLETDYKFDEVEALSSEIYHSDTDPDPPQQELILTEKLYNKTDNVYSPEETRSSDQNKKSHRHSLLPLAKWKKNSPKNYSNISIHGISSDCLNDGMMVTGSVFGSLVLGIAAGIFV